MPRRIKFSRSKGYRLPENGRLCARPSRYANPFPIGKWARFKLCSDTMGEFYSYQVEASPPTLDNDWVLVDNNKTAVSLFRRWLELRHGTDEMVKDLSRYDYLACYCSLDDVCHVDVWIELVDAYLETQR